jgi:hypothetical protein
LRLKVQNYPSFSIPFDLIFRHFSSQFEKRDQFKWQFDEKEAEPDDVLLAEPDCILPEVANHIPLAVL